MSNTKLGRYNRVKFQSSKLGKTIFCRSLLLRDFLIHLEWDENIISYELYPFKIHFLVDGKSSYLRPQVLTEDLQQKKVIHLLRSADSDSEDLQKKHNIASQFCAEKGLAFRVETDSQIRENPYFFNLKLLRKYARCEVTATHQELCNRFFKAPRSAKIKQLIDHFESLHFSSEIVYALLYHKVITADIHSSALDGETLVNFAGKNPNLRAWRTN